MYQTPEVLNATAHGQLTYQDPGSFAFAATQTSAPLLDEEVALASAHYVIAFPLESSARPLALLGLREKNCYLDHAGRWTASYIPAFIRRYPFTFGADSQSPEALHLTIDTSAPHFSDRGELLFAADGEPTQIARNAMDFMTAYQKAALRTESAHKALYDAGLIVPRYLTIEQDGITHTIGGFGVVDREKLNALADETLATWARSGLLATVYAHWASLRHLQALVAAEARPETTN